MTLAVFNPWHDMALAAGTPHYQPPRSAMVMAEELQHLARLWEEEGKVTVWGWDALVVHRLAKQGVPRDMMPTDEQLAEIRRLSSRHTAVKALATLSPALSLKGEGDLSLQPTAGFKSFWCETKDELRAAINYALRITHYALLKSPWSCSGKGLMRISSPLPTGEGGKGGEAVSPQWSWARNILTRQGGIVVEPFYEDKLRDFALEYEVRDGQAHYLGLSLFDTTSGTYTGNILDTEAHKRALLGIPDTTLQRIIDQHLLYINKEIAPHYDGPLGIDLMLMHDGAIHPCVEINLRRTMGWVALQLECTTPLPATFAIKAGKHYEAVVEKMH